MIKALVASGVLLTSVSGTAVAADWTGWHVGGHIGYAENDLNGYYDTFGSEPIADFTDAEDDAVAYGVQVGYDWQRDNYVLGVEVNYTKTNLDGKTNIDGEDNFHKITSDDYWSISGRVGTLINDKTLIYATAGIARVDNELRVEIPETGSNRTQSYDETTALIGAGVEYAYNKNWSLRAEALYIDVDIDQSGYDLEVVHNLNDADENDSLSIDGLTVLKIGVNYRF